MFPCAVDSMVLAAAPLNLCQLLCWLAGGHIIRAKGNMHACAKFHGNPIAVEISHSKPQPHDGARQEARGSLNSST